MIILHSLGGLLNQNTAPSESDASGSDYSTTVREKRRRASRVHEESEKSSVDSDMGSDEGDRTVSRGARQPQSVGGAAHRRVDKGKGRARSPASDMEQLDTAAMQMHKKPGPFSNAAKEEIAAFADSVMARADQLAETFGKTRHDILVQAGLGSVKSTRALNSANVFRKWYSAHYPKPDRGMCLETACLLDADELHQ